MQVNAGVGTSTVAMGALEVSADFGVGDMPAELDRLNWSAVFWGPLWALVHRNWRWFWLLSAFFVVSAAFIVWAYRSPHPLETVVLAAILGQSVTLLPCIWFGSVANREFWDRRRARPLPSRPRTVESFARAQREWAQFPLALLALRWLGETVRYFTQQGVAPSAFSIAWDATFVVTVAIVFLWSRRHEGRIFGR